MPATTLLHDEKILVLDNIDSKAVEILRAAGLDVDEMKTPAPTVLKEIISDYSAVLVRSNTKVTAEILQEASNLKVVGRAGTGVDNIDVPAATANGVLVMNANGNTISAAEHTFGMLLAAARFIPAADKSMKEGKWDKSRFIGTELNGKTLGIVGFGRVGRAVAKRALAFDMTVLSFDPVVSPQDAAKENVRLVSMEDLLPAADFVSLHAALPPQADQKHKPLLGREEIALCKQGARIVNCARGELIDPQALYEALERGHIASVALDVFENEPLFANGSEGNESLVFEKLLVGHDRAIVTPHIGASTKDAQDNVARMIAEQVRDFLIEGTVTGAVNTPSAPAKIRGPYRPSVFEARQGREGAAALRPA